MMLMDEQISKYDMLIQCFETGQMEVHQFIWHMDHDEVFQKYATKKILDKRLQDI